MLNPVSRPVMPEVGSIKRDQAVAPATGNEEAQKAAASSREGQKAQLSAQIMQASMDVSISSGNNSLALLYRSAIDSINEHLAPALGPNAIQNAMGQDNSPEGTAGRILSMSTGFYEAYAAQRPNDDPEEVLRDFVDVIRGGFEKGYNEAVGILQGLGVMGEGSFVAEEIGKTFTLVQQGYDDFLESMLARLKPAEAEGSQEPAGA
ncbi:DUF5610 domain-containing protein [Thiopseudomonas denitrificans]|uniref:DUF5610 domain-containing protein n=1 Tax=Thiopseudomonas denitrificans TaxID=1501432 RepID=A0A4R6UA51_9GAMM|nr:DUF5610 domain-containing protein [Thiopseudomonas denitrificans]TDQ39944.1 hypothetical protein DFQ45_10176 [Thiopseudomonas denitrificans]